MKKLLLLLAFAFVGAMSANAQCTPDPQYTTPGIYPDSATGMAPACVGQAYSQLITNVVPQDTCVVIIPGFPCQTVTIDSIVIIDFQGLPASMTYACSSSLGTNCSFPGGEAGCAIITGTPTVGEIGTHPLTITVSVYAGGLSQQEVIDWYFIEVNDCNPTGISENALAGLALYPNPAENMITIEGVNSDVVTITDLNGKTLMVVETNNSNKVEINISTLDNGIYIANTNNGMIRFVKQ